MSFRNSAFAISLIICHSCRGPGSYLTLEGQAQGTTYSIKYEFTHTDVENGIDSILEVVDHNFSLYLENSVISSLNRSDKSIPATPLFKILWERCWELNIETNGYFDPTLAPVLRLYDFDHPAEMQLDTEEVNAALKCTGMHLFELEDDRIIKKLREAKLDLNGIAQGLTVDLISEFLEDQNIRNFLVELGGEVSARGVNEKKETWLVGIDKPVNSADRSLISKIRLQNRSVATSGNYRKFKMVNGMRTGHIINPKTGLFRKTNILSASVLSEKCYRADALATAFVTMTLDEIRNLIETSSDLLAIIVYEEGGDTLTFITPGLEPAVVK